MCDKKEKQFGCNKYLTKISQRCRIVTVSLTNLEYNGPLMSRLKNKKYSFLSYSFYFLLHQYSFLNKSFTTDLHCRSSVLLLETHTA